MVAGINAAMVFDKQDKVIYPEETVIGSLAKYISSPKDNFQPMNANFGFLPELNINVKEKKERYLKYAERSLNIIRER